MSEGIIKFKCDWIKADALPSEDIKELNDARMKLYEQKLIGADKDGIGYGNISMRYKDKQFIISGSQTGGIKNTNAKHYTLITEYDIEKNRVKCTGPIIASSETMTHAALYELTNNINCVIHIHDISIWKNKINTLPTTNSDIRYGTPEMAFEIKNLWDMDMLSDNKIIIMGGHEGGVISFGQYLDTTLYDVINLKS